MTYEAIGPIEATEFELAGAPMVAVAVDGLAHCVDANTFKLLFRPQVEQVFEYKPHGLKVDLSAMPTREMRGSVEAAQEGVIEATRRNMKAIREHNGAAKSTRSPVRRGLTRGSDVLDLTGYPEALQNPLATTIRAIWDALKTPKSMPEIEKETRLGSSTLYSDLTALRNKCLAHKRDSDGKWERTVEE